MAVIFKHSSIYSMYFCTFTGYNWLHLFEQTNSYDLVYDWFTVLKKKSVDIVAYVIMPNHVHCILNFPDENFNLNKVLSNGKRFMAYQIINRLEAKNEHQTLKYLHDALSERERKKGQLHKVFKDSFDAKPVFSEKFLIQKLNYIHLNPVTGKWKLADDFSLYEHSSASFYESGIAKLFLPKHYMEL